MAAAQRSGVHISGHEADGVAPPAGGDPNAGGAADGSSGDANAVGSANWAMGLALAEARAAIEHEDVPVGAVVIANGELLASRHNERQRTGDPTAHAEVLALRDAAKALGTWRLDGTTLVTTLEPCVMCAGAALAARVAKVTFGAFDPKAGAASTLYNVLVDPRMNHQCEVVGGVLAEECGRLLSEFFAQRRGSDRAAR